LVSNFNDVLIDIITRRISLPAIVDRIAVRRSPEVVMGTWGKAFHYCPEETTGHILNLGIFLCPGVLRYSQFIKHA
jgi:hypothetical protein